MFARYVFTLRCVCCVLGFSGFGFVFVFGVLSLFDFGFVFGVYAVW